MNRSQAAENLTGPGHPSPTTASCLLDSSSHLNLLQRMFWRLPRLSEVIHKEHAATVQLLQSRGREQQDLGRGGTEDMLESFLSLQPRHKAGRTPARSPWNCKRGHRLQGWAQHQHLELAPSQKIPGCGLEDGGKRAGSEGRPTASSDTQPENRREPGGCGSGAGALRSHSWGWRRKARGSRLSKDQIIF